MHDDVNFGVIYNDDSGGAYDWIEGSVDALVARTEANLVASVNGLAGTPVGTLCYCVSRGGDIMHYPTRVATPWGWRPLADAGWSRRSAIARTVLDAGLDPVRVVAEQARGVGLLFLPSFRVNDLHFTADPEGSFLTPRFWFEHQDLVVGTVPKSISSWYEQAPDFSHEIVRCYKLAVIDEILDRYADTLDGLELDFLRHPVFFPDGAGPQRGHLITELVRHVRRRLDAMARTAARPHHLLVRVPTDLETCRNVGLEVDRWIIEGLIDVVIPATHYFTAYDMPITPLVDLAHDHDQLVFPSLYPRQVDAWPFADHGAACVPFSKHGPPITPRRMRGAAANYRAMGVDGFALFNFHLDRSDRSDVLYRMIRDLATPSCLHRADKVFAITKPGWLSDHPVSFRKRLPVKVVAGEAYVFELFVGEDFDDPVIGRTCRLRLGWRGLAPDAKIAVDLNGRPQAVEASTPVVCGQAMLERNELLADCFVPMMVAGTSLCVGVNAVTVRADRAATLTDVELLVAYAPLDFV